MIPSDPVWMRRALKAARRGWGTTHPNPMVGAVLATPDKLLSEGFHQYAGQAHAEVRALEAFPEEIPPEATLYITLEPCSSTGRTPPCTGAILARNVRRVVVGALDDDPRHRGRGLALLREAGVDVVQGVLEADCLDLNLIFHHLHGTGRPLVAAKIATTIDGRTATATGSSRWITGDQARRDVHRWRRYFPAIGVGAGTVLADDPSLTARSPEGDFCPRRVIFDRSGHLASSPDRTVFTDVHSAETMVLTAGSRVAALRRSLPGAVRVTAMETGPDFLADWLRSEGLSGLYVEGGAGLLGSLLAAGSVDYLFAYRAPLLFLDPRAPGPGEGGSPQNPADGLRLERVRHEVFGEDQLMRGFVQRSGNHKILC